MKRLMVYPGAIPLETDLLNIQRNTMIALSKLSEVLFGTGSTVLYGLGCTATSPASLQVNIAPGQIYLSDSVDVFAFSSLAADTDHTLLKQGLMLDKLTLNCPAPVTFGFSINYLVQVTFQEVDDTPVTLPYYNSSNPAVAYTGPNNSGGAQNTMRTGQCVVTVKAGAAATTGTQTTPNPDASHVGIWVVAVAYGQTTITAGSISPVPNAPFFEAQFQAFVPVSTAVELYLTGAHKSVFVTDAVPIHLPVYLTVSHSKEYQIKNNSDGSIPIDASDGKLIDGAATFMLLGPGDKCTIVKDGTNWQTIA